MVIAALASLTLTGCSGGPQRTRPTPRPTPTPALTVKDPCESEALTAGDELHNRVFDGGLSNIYTFNGSINGKTNTVDPDSITYTLSLPELQLTGGAAVTWNYGTDIRPVGGIARFRSGTQYRDQLLGPNDRKIVVPTNNLLYFLRLCGVHFYHARGK
jgi:hypothetical protein